MIQDWTAERHRDEVGDLHGASQAKVLCVLQEGKSDRVGGAARALGMERTNLHKRIRALGLSRGK